MPHLASYGQAALPVAVNLLRDESVPIWSRIGAAEMLGRMAATYPEERQRILEALRAQLPSPDRLTQQPAQPATDEQRLWTWVVANLAELRDVASREQVTRLFADGLLDDSVIGLEDYLADLEAEVDLKVTDSSQFDVLKEYSELYAAELRDREYRARMAEQQARQRPVQRKYSLPPDPTSTTYIRSQPKLGRNDPCHRGSGRKYKHCHGRP